MIDVNMFCTSLKRFGFDFFAGVPDSLLSSFCSCAMKNSGDRFVITANEGNAVGVAAGHYLAEKKPAVVFMQNSGIGNAVNPLVSLADTKVYSIPMLLIVGWRGEPGVKDEPQHLRQGEITHELFRTMGIETITLADDYETALSRCARITADEKIAALIIRKNTFSPFHSAAPESRLSLTREQALRIITDNLNEDDIIVSTTGKTSRELFEIREAEGSGHSNDFLTVGSMGHSSSIALGVSLGTNRRVVCIDGDGAFIMHMGACAVNAANAGENFRYIIINNGAHESVGGQPTVGFKINMKEILHGCGFDHVFTAETSEETQNCLRHMMHTGRSALIIFTRQGSRADLGRPTLSPVENRNMLMEVLHDESTDI